MGRQHYGGAARYGLVFTEGPNGKADRAYDSHYTPIPMMAKAVYTGWVSITTLQAAVRRTMLRLAAADYQWAVVRRATAAILATTNRLGWQVADAITIGTNE